MFTDYDYCESGNDYFTYEMFTNYADEINLSICDDDDSVIFNNEFY